MKSRKTRDSQDAFKTDNSGVFLVCLSEAGGLVTFELLSFVLEGSTQLVELHGGLLDEGDV